MLILHYYTCNIYHHAFLGDCCLAWEIVTFAFDFGQLNMVQDYVFPFVFFYLVEAIQVLWNHRFPKLQQKYYCWTFLGTRLFVNWYAKHSGLVVSKSINSIWFLVLNRISLISIMFLDWRMCGMKKPPSCRELTFFNFQMMSLHPHVHLACASSMEEGLERALEMRDRQTWRHPGEVHLMEDNGLIFFSLSISCKYYNNMDK